MIKGTPHYAPWADDPDLSDHWSDDQYKDMRNRLRKHWGLTTDANWTESLHPRDEEGKFTFAGAGDGGKVQGLPDGAKLNDRLMAQSLERKAFVAVAKPIKGSDFDSAQRIRVTTTARIPDEGIDEFEMRPATGKLGYYNPKLADLVTEDKGVEYIEHTHAMPKAGLATEITPLAEEGVMYRGMRAEEYEQFLKTGEVVSTGKYNMAGQEGLTYWADHPSTAESYANSFAPWPHKATFERPAYVVAAKIPKGDTKKIEGTGENEIGVTRAMKADEVIAVWRGDVYAHTPGEADFREVAENDFSFSGGRAASTSLVWSKVEREEAKPKALKLGGGGDLKARIGKAIDEAHAELFPNPLAEHQIGFANEHGHVAMMELEDYGDSLYVKWLTAHPQKSGMGTEAMEYLKELATKHDVPLTLTPWEDGEIGAEKLTAIFKKWGFKPGSQGLLRWTPPKRTSDARPWREDLYERGQPENKGQFASKGAAGGSEGKASGGGGKTRARPNAAAALAAAKKGPAQRGREAVAARKAAEKQAAAKAAKPAESKPETQHETASAKSLYKAPTLTADQIIDTVPGAREAVDKVYKKLDAGTPTDALVKDGGYKQEDGSYTPERQAIHREIVSRFINEETVRKYAPDPGQSPTLTVLGGRGGSGKSWLTRWPEGPVNPGRTMVIDNDAVKEMLPEYEGWNAALVHEEASHIVELIDDAAARLGLNVTLDGTLKSNSILQRIAVYQKPEEHEYDLEGYYMYASPQTAATRALGRFSKGGKFDGRFVPPEVVLSNTKNEENFDALTKVFKHWAVYDNDEGSGGKPKLIEQKRKRAG